MSLSLDLAPLVTLGLMATRMLTFIAVVPALGLRTAPVPVKVAVALWLAAAGLPAAMASAVPAPTHPASLALALTGEVLAGLLLSFTVLLIFAAFQLAGQIAGMQVGFTIANTIDPLSQMQISVLGQVYYALAAVAFVAVDGHLLALQGIYQSFALLPPGRPPLGVEGILDLVGLAGGIFSAGLRIAAPPVVSLLLVSITMGVIGRTVTQLNILVVGFPLKILIGLVMAALSMPLLHHVLSSEMAALPERLGGLAGALAAGR